jgi:hypothetical protein
MLEFLGLILDSICMEAQLPDVKLAYLEYRTFFDHGQQKPTVSFQNWKSSLDI